MLLPDASWTMVWTGGEKPHCLSTVAATTIEPIFALTSSTLAKLSRIQDASCQGAMVLRGVVRLIGHVAGRGGEVEQSGGEPRFVEAVDNDRQPDRVGAEARVFRFPLQAVLVVRRQADALKTARRYDDVGVKIDREFERARVDDRPVGGDRGGCRCRLRRRSRTTARRPRRSRRAFGRIDRQASALLRKKPFSAIAARREARWRVKHLIARVAGVDLAGRPRQAD